MKVTTGVFENGFVYARIGDKPRILVSIEALSFDHEPPAGFTLKSFMNAAKPFLNDYTVYHINRKQNMPEGYFLDQMAEDYAEIFKKDFQEPVDIMGVSTGGQICHYLAANYPELIRKVAIISAAYRLSDSGVEIEHRTGEYFAQKKYAKAMVSLMEGVVDSRFVLGLIKIMMFFFAKRLLGKQKYPNDFLIEIAADREMNFRDRLHDIRAPTLILCGDRDKFYSKEDVEITAHGIPNAELRLFKNYGHNLVMANGKQVYKEVLDFLLRE